MVVSAVSVGDIGVSCRDAFHMGAVLALGIVVMGDVQIIVHVVVAKRNFGVDIQLVRRDAGHVKLVHYPVDFCRVQQVVVCYRLTSIGCLFLQGVVKGAGVEGLVICVDTGVNDGNPRSCTGVAGGIRCAGTDHRGGSGHVGIRFQLGIYYSGVIPVFYVHTLDAWHLFNFRDLTVLHIGGNRVGSQGQIPNHIQLFTSGFFDFGLHIGLVLLQAGAVGHGRMVVGNVLCGETCVQGGLFLQDDRDTGPICACGLYFCDLL
ncbi:unknown [Firmicutes bacterium CAG:137]|nr:unknown [Firmicutes bacterium CAG:137]